MNILRSRERKIEEEAVTKIGNTFENVSDKVVDATTEFSEKSMKTIKTYPLHTALAAGAVGLLLGALAGRK